MKKTPDVPFAGSQLIEARQVCAYFTSANEGNRILLPFIEDGFECGRKAVHALNPCRRPDHVQGLTDAGIDVTATQRSGQFLIQAPQDGSGEPFLTVGSIEVMQCLILDVAMPGMSSFDVRI